MNLAHTTAIVTGASAGIGRQTALRLARAGARVGLAARSEDKLRFLQEEIHAAGGSAVALPVDIRSAASTRSAAAKAENELGPVNLLVNNAGAFNAIGPFWEVDPETWWNDVSTNLQGAFLCCRAFVPAMMERQTGRIVNVVGGGTGVPFPMGSAYGSSKAALMRFTESIAAELEGTGVKVIALFPGLVRTAMTELQLESPAGQKWLPRIRELFAEGADVPPTAAAELVAEIAAGRWDALAGRATDVRFDHVRIKENIAVIKDQDLLTLRLTGEQFLEGWTQRRDAIRSEPND